ncbi:MAG: hypothetical protein M1832_001408 [Thelocarpon impressellum]|nr:MAG: hypothetical protein M1832_001408 [Thelocarpon impressellum]
MKRKFSFNIMPIKVFPPSKVAVAAPPVDSRMIPSEPSPDFEPDSPFISRRSLSPHTEAGLRKSCVSILRAQDESARFFENARRPEPATGRGRELRRTASQAAEAHAQLNRRHSDAGRRQYRGRHEKAPPPPGPATPAFKHVPRNAATSFNLTATSRSASVTRGRRDSVDYQDHGPALDRPHTAAPAYDASIASASTNTWRMSDNTYSRSTGITTMPSASHTPAEWQDPESQARADARARTWMAEELARRRAEQDRPSSRGSSRVIEYLRPRSSRGSLRSAYTVESNSSTWWRAGGSLRRHNSNASQQAYLDDGEPPPPPPPPVQAVDLNRALPPLPSLSTWDSETPRTGPGVRIGAVHITELVTTETAAVDERAQATALERMRQAESKKHEWQQSMELRKMVEHKMRVASVESPASSLSAPPTRENGRASQSRRGRNDYAQPNVRTREAQRRPPPASPPSADRKMGRLMRTLSRLNLGGSGRRGKPEPRTYGNSLSAEMAPRSAVRAR